MTPHPGPADSSPTLPEQSAAPRTARLFRPHLLLLVVIGLLISFRLLPDEFHFFGDETRHAVTGVFFRDLLVDLPWKHPLQYTYEYYAKYPALGLLHWPPLFHFVEGVFFLLFGISVWASRLTVLMYALLGVHFWYRIAESQGPVHRALLSAFIFPLLPFMLLYERSTMLEIPLVSLCLGAIYYWQRFLEAHRAHDLWLLAALSAGALLTNQKAIFLVFFFGLHFLIERPFRLLRRWDVWIATLLAAAVVLPWYLLTLRTVSLSYERGIGQGFQHVGSPRHLLFYVERVPDQLGLVLTILALAGFVWALIRAPYRYRFLLLWILSCYVCFTLIQEKDIRHTMIWVPPLVYFALWTVEILCARRQWALLASAGLAAYILVAGLRFDRPRMVGMEEAARFVLAQPDSDIVYYQGLLNGNFIFFVRKYDPEKRHMVAREKQVVATKIVPGYGTRQILQSEDEVLDFFRNWGIRYAVLESSDFIEGLSPVRRVLLSEQFELIRVFSLSSNNAELARRKIHIYRFRGEIRRADQPVVIPMMTLRSDIRADLKRLAGRPWPN